jgi:hypothetical protein
MGITLFRCREVDSHLTIALLCLSGISWQYQAAGHSRTNDAGECYRLTAALTLAQKITSDLSYVLSSCAHVHLVLSEAVPWPAA